MNFGIMGRNERAVHFLENWYSLNRKELNQLLPEIWTLAEWPGLMADYEEWSEIFYEAGFCSDDGTRRPENISDKMVIYRAATPNHIYGMGWTSSLETAKWFNDRNHQFGWKDSKIYKSETTVGNILAIFNRRKENEIIVDPSLIRFKGVEVIL